MPSTHRKLGDVPLTIRMLSECPHGIVRVLSSRVVWITRDTLWNIEVSGFIAPVPVKTLDGAVACDVRSALFREYGNHWAPMSANWTALDWVSRITRFSHPGHPASLKFADSTGYGFGPSFCVWRVFPGATSNDSHLIHSNHALVLA